MIRAAAGWLFIAGAAAFAFSCRAEQPNADIVDTTPLSRPRADIVDTPPLPRVAHDPKAAEVLEPEPDAAAEEKPNQPRVVITADGEARPGCWYMLDGSATKDPLSYSLHFQWRQSAGPAVSVSGDELTQAKLWLFLTQPGNYRFALTATNENGISATRDAKFTVAAGQPSRAESEGRKVVGFGEQVSLPGEGWSQACGPEVELRADDDGYHFRPARAGLYIFEAPRAGDVPERRGVVVPPGRTPPFGARRPIASLTKNMIGKANKPLIIDGSLSRHPDGPEETQALKAVWVTLDKSRGVELVDLAGLRARFTATHPGMYQVKLAVTDGKLVSAAESVFIRVDAEDSADDPATNVTETEDPPELAREDIRYSRVRLGLWEGNLDRAVQLFPSRAGVALRVDPDMALPEKVTETPLALEVNNGPLQHLIDWIARQSDSWYRREHNVSFWLTRANGWIKDEDIRTKVVQADAMSVKPDGSDFMRLIKPWADRIISKREGTSLTYERQAQTIDSTLPVSANGRVEEICGSLRLPMGSGLPPPDLPTAIEWRLRKTLAEKMITIKAERLRVDLLLREISQQAGVAIGMDPRQFPKGLPRVTVDIQDAPLRDAVRTIVDLAGFSGCSVETPSGLWFYKGARPYPNRELLWDQALVQTYDLTRLLAQISPISGEMIAHEIQCRIFPETWSDPGALVFYHPSTRKLLVMHGPDAQRRVLDFLYDLAERGEWALGPVEEK